MRLEKVIIDGVVYYKEIAQEEVSARPEEVAEAQEDTFRKFRKHAQQSLQKALAFIKAKGEVVKGKVREGWERLLRAPDNDDDILLLLPYMDEESRSEVFRQLIKNTRELKECSLERLLPYFRGEECDTLILYAVEHLHVKNICALAKYASEDCLSRLVDGYIIGQYPTLDIESIYPHLSKSDIKRLFDYYVTKK